MVEEARRSGKTDQDQRPHGRRPTDRGCGAISRPRRPDVASLTGRPLPGPAEITAGRAPVKDDLATALAAVAAAAANGPQALAGVIKAFASQPSAREASGTSGNSPGALPDIGIVDDDADGVSHGRYSYRQKDKDMPRYFGPYPHRGRWRIVTRQDGRQNVQSSHSTEEEAKRELRKLRAEAAKQAGLSVGKAIGAYLEKLRRNGVRERSIATTDYRLRKLFGPVLAQPLPTVTPAKAKELFSALGGSVDSRRNILNQTRTFSRRAREYGWTDQALLADVKGEGKRRCGKQKLTLDESRKFLAACLELTASANAKKRTAGIGSAMALLFGMRASEITDLPVRDLDAGGTVIRIAHAKSQAGIRALQVPEWFRPHLQRLAEGKSPSQPLIGHNRSWLYRNVRALCRKAGVTEAPPHGLRGTHADLALMAAATPLSVSKALGHSSTAVTFRHYADQGIAESRDHERAIESLAPTVAAPPN